MKLVLIGLAAAGVIFSQPSAVLDVTVTAMNPPAPVSFARIEVNTPAGKRIASAFSTAQGTAQFHLPEGAYVVVARSDSVAQCGTQSRGTVTALCSGHARVSVSGASQPNRAAIVILPPSASRPRD